MKYSDQLQAFLVFCSLLLFIGVVYSSCTQPSTGVNSISKHQAYNLQTVLNELEKYVLSVVGEPRVQEIILPNEFTDSNWSIKAAVCEAGGYDLNQYAGRPAFLTAYNLNETYFNEPLNVYVLTEGNQVICAYKAVRGSSSLAPGVFVIDALL